MARYHINNADEVGVCKAGKESCPFGGESGEENHYSSQEEARQEAEKRLEEKHGLVNKIYKAGAKDTSEAEALHPEVKKRIINESTAGKSKLHPSVVAKVFAKDRDELVRRRVASKVKSQNVLRKMADDDSAKVRLSVAQSTKNPEVLKKLSTDDDSAVRNAALKNERMPKRAKKKTLESIKQQQALKRDAGKIDLSDSSHYENADVSTRATTLNDETLSKIRASGKSAYELKGFDEDRRPVPGLKGDYSLEEVKSNRGSSNESTSVHMTYYGNLNHSRSTNRKVFKSREDARKWAKENLNKEQIQYSEEETAKENRENERIASYYDSKRSGGYTGD